MLWEKADALRFKVYFQAKQGSNYWQRDDCCYYLPSVQVFL